MVLASCCSGNLNGIYYDNFLKEVGLNYNVALSFTSKNNIKKVIAFDGDVRVEGNVASFVPALGYFFAPKFNSPINEDVTQYIDPKQGLMKRDNVEGELIYQKTNKNTVVVSDNKENKLLEVDLNSNKILYSNLNGTKINQ